MKVVEPFLEKEGNIIAEELRKKYITCRDSEQNLKGSATGENFATEPIFQQKFSYEKPQ